MYEVRPADNLVPSKTFRSIFARQRELNRFQIELDSYMCDASELVGYESTQEDKLLIVTKPMNMKNVIEKE